MKTRALKLSHFLYLAFRGNNKMHFEETIHFHISFSVDLHIFLCFCLKFMIISLISCKTEKLNSYRMWYTFDPWLSFPSALCWKQPRNTELLKLNNTITILYFLFLRQYFFYQMPLFLLINLSDRVWSTMPHLNLSSQTFKLCQT